MPLVELLVSVLLIAANAFFVAAEFSLARLRPTQVDGWERSGRPGAASVRHAVERIDAYLAACQLGITIASLGLGAVGERAFEHLLGPAIGDEATLVGVGIAGALSFVLITMLHVVLGELSPKSVAIARTGPTALFIAPPMRVFYTATRPIVDGLNWLGNLVLKPFGVPPAREAGHAPHTEEELRALVAESGREGMIDPGESAFTDNVLTFGDRCASDVMVPRASVRYLSVDAAPADAVGTIRASGFTRLPLCRPGRGLDDVVGVVHVKDLAGADLRTGDLERVARPLDAVPATMALDDVLERFRTRREHLALVVDADARAIGILTLEDVLTQIVGGIEDEFDHVDARG